MAEIKIKMEKTAIILSAIVGFLGLLSAILGFAAEGSPMPALGISALVFLLMAQITVTAVSGCCGCCKSRAIPSETKRVIGIVCAVGSWIAAVAGCVMFEQNAALTFSTGLYIPGLYAGGGVLALAATALSIASYMLLLGVNRRPPPLPGSQRANHSSRRQHLQARKKHPQARQTCSPPPQAREQV